MKQGPDNAQTLRDEVDTMVVEGIPLDARSVLIGIAELAKDERRAPIQFPLLRHNKLAHNRLEAVVECRGDGNRKEWSQDLCQCPR